MLNKEQMIDRFWEELNHIVDNNTKKQNIEFLKNGIWELKEKYSINEEMEEYFEEESQELDEAIFEIHKENCCKKSYFKCEKVEW